MIYKIPKKAIADHSHITNLPSKEGVLFTPEFSTWIHAHQPTKFKVINKQVWIEIHEPHIIDNYIQTWT